MTTTSISRLCRTLLLLSAAALPALAHAQVSLATVVDLAQRNSSAVKLAQADVEKANALLDQTHDAYIPNFSLGSNVGYSHGFPTGQPSVGTASMQSLVFSYSQLKYGKAAHAGVDAAMQQLKDAKEQAALDASTTYIELDTVNRELERRLTNRRNSVQNWLRLKSSVPKRALILTSTFCRPPHPRNENTTAPS